MKPLIALDCRIEHGKPSSYTRVLELLRAGAEAVGLPYADWNGGACPASVLWSATPDLPDEDLGVPLLPTLHDITPLLPDDRGALKRWRNARRFRRSVRALDSRAARVITVSDFARRSIAAEFPELAPRLRVVPNYPSAKFQPAAHETVERSLAELRLPARSVLFLAALRRHKNWETLLRAWAAMPAPLREAHPLVLAGDAHRARGRPERIARDLGVDGELHLPGRIPEEHLVPLLGSAAVFVFPSFAEGFGLPPLEAMACGTAVISSDSTSLPEVLGEACRYFPPERVELLTAALGEVLGDDELRAELGRLGVRQARRWSALRTGRAMVSALEGLVPDQSLALLRAP